MHLKVATLAYMQIIIKYCSLFLYIRVNHFSSNSLLHLNFHPSSLSFRAKFRTQPQMEVVIHTSHTYHYKIIELNIFEYTDISLAIVKFYVAIFRVTPSNKSTNKPHYKNTINFHRAIDIYLYSRGR